MEIRENNTPSQEKRPKILTILCILSFIGSGMGMIAYLFYGLMFNEVETMIEEGQFAFPGIEILMSGGNKYFLMGSLLYLISFAGVLFMWKMRAIGFHLYTAAQILMLILPFFSTRELSCAIRRFYHYPYLYSFISQIFADDELKSSVIYEI